MIDLGLPVLIFAIPFIPTQYLLYISMVLTVLAVLKWIDDNNYNDYYYNPVIIPVLVFFTGALVSTVFSVDLSLSIRTLLLYGMYFMAFILPSLTIKKKWQVKAIILSLISSGVILAGMGINQYKSGVETARSWVDVTRFPELATRVYATLENPNVLAEYLVFLLPVVIAMVLVSKTIIHKVVFAVSGGLMLITLVYTHSRGGWLSFAIAAAIFLLLMDKRWIPVIILAAIISPFILPSSILDRASTITDIEESSNAFRITIWRGTLKMLRDFWHTGIGLGMRSFAMVYPNYMVTGTPAVHSHNLFLQMAIEMGIWGPVSFLWIIRNYLKFTIKSLKDMDISMKAFLAALISGVIAHLIHGMVDNVWYNPKVTLLFWTYLGLAIAIIKNFKRVGCVK